MKFLAGGGVAVASGSIGGTTFSRNRYGAYTRTRAIPVNPASTYQVAVRGYVALLTSAWLNQLTAAQRASWDTYGENVAMQDKLGQTIFLTGLNHYVRSNVPRLQAGLPRVDDGPIVYNLGDLTTPVLAWTAADDKVNVSFTEADDWVGEDDAGMLVYGSRSVAASRNFFAGPYRFADSIDGDSTTPPTTPVAMDNPFPVETGTKLFGYVRVTRADGRLSSLFRSGGLAA